LNELYKEQPVKAAETRRGKGKGAEAAGEATENLLQ